MSFEALNVPPACYSSVSIPLVAQWACNIARKTPEPLPRLTTAIDLARPVNAGWTALLWYMLSDII